MDAVRLETACKNDPSVQPDKLPGKDEFFECPPTKLVELTQKLAVDVGIDIYRNMPYNISLITEASDDFPSLPSAIRRSLTQDCQECYLLGIKNALWVLSYLDGEQLRSVNFRELWSTINHMDDESELWSWLLAQVPGARAPYGSSEDATAHGKARSDWNAGFQRWQESD